MSRDPERLLGARGAADELERELLGRVKGVEPPAGMKDAAWLGIAEQIAAGAAVGTAAAATGNSVAPSAAAAKAGMAAWLPSALAVKLAWTLAAGGLLAGGVFAVQRLAGAAEKRGHERGSAAVSSAAAAKPEAAVPAAPSVQPRVVPAAPAAIQPEPAVGDEPQAQPVRRGKRRPDLLAEESALLANARAQLRAGDAVQARATLARLSAQFPRGELVQEREVLAIELLFAEGQAEAARRRARAFVQAYPRSPHSAKLSRLLDPP